MRTKDLVCERNPKRVNVRQVVVKHSPTGLEWGYGGSGPADLALNTLLAFGCSRQEAERLYMQFKWDVIAEIPREGGVVSAEVIRDWIDERREEHA